jgi:hypothetical protein
VPQGETGNAELLALQRIDETCKQLQQQVITTDVLLCLHVRANAR